MEDTATPILQTDASDYGIGGYVFIIRLQYHRTKFYFQVTLHSQAVNYAISDRDSIDQPSIIDNNNSQYTIIH